jgi:hypothetical protein
MELSKYLYGGGEIELPVFLLYSFLLSKLLMSFSKYAKFEFLYGIDVAVVQTPLSQREGGEHLE